MLACRPELLIKARAAARAVPAFTVYTLKSIRAACDAAEHTGLPVILQAGSSSYRGTSQPMLAAAAIAAARAASVPVGVHLDHATDVEDIRDCLALAGDEDTSTGAKALFLLTDLEHAREFVERTSVDALATAVGTVHGLTTAPVAIDLDGLHTIAKLKNLPQVLHGASGLADSQVRAAVDAGVARVNINAELRRAYLAALATALAQASDDLRQVQRQTVTAMAEVAADKLTLLGGGGQTGGQARKGLR